MSGQSVFRVTDLSQRRATSFALSPDAGARAALAEELGLSALRKLTFEGSIDPMGARDWRLTGRLGATVVQPCVVTLEPVTTRIDAEVARTYLAEILSSSGISTSSPAGAVMAEALALAVPLYPRADGVELGDAVFAGPGVTPLSDEAAKPFAGLAALRDKLGGKE